MDLQKCLSLLRNARTDNEKMAALLLVSKLVQSNKIEPEGRKMIFDAVGFSFINRLLSTKDIPEGCTVNPYHKIAVILLASFCTDQDLVHHPQITSKIPLFNEFTQQSPSTAEDEDSSIAEDSLQCLQALGGFDSGLQHLMRYNTPEVLAKVFINQVPVSNAARDLLVHILGQKVVQTSVNFSANASATLGILAKEFATNQDELKFNLCDVLCSLLLSLGEALVSQPPLQSSWLPQVSHGLKDILMSKVDAPRQSKAIHLSATLCQMLGVEWAAAESTRFFVLLVHLACVEVKLAMDGKGIPEVVENSSILCSCFIIMESSVVYMAKQSELMELGDPDKKSLLSQEDLLQIHTTLNETFPCIVQFLKSTVSWLCEKNSTIISKSQEDAATTISQLSLSLHTPLVVASVRVLGAWLAEDSLSLSSDIYTLLPSLIKLSTNAKHPAESGFYDEDGDLLKFLLPGLCHLTADDKPRKVLLKANFHKSLLSYMQALLPHYESSSQLSGRVSLCCGILMNVCVCDPDKVKNDDTFTSIALCSLKVISDVKTTTNSLRLNMALLLLMIIRRQGAEQFTSQANTPLTPVWHRILQLLLHTLQECPSIKGICRSSQAKRVSFSEPNVCTKSWDDMSELWFLAMQELTALIPLSKEVRHCVSIESSVLQCFTEMLPAIADHQNGNEELQSISTSLCTLLQAVSQDSQLVQ